MATPTEESTPIYDQLVKEFAARVAFEHFFGPDKEEDA